MKLDMLKAELDMRLSIYITSSLRFFPEKRVAQLSHYRARFNRATTLEQLRNELNRMNDSPYKEEMREVIARWTKQYQLDAAMKI